MRIIVFQIGAERFGIDIMEIKKIVERTETVNDTMACIMDAAELSDSHGGIIPVFDLHEKFQIKPLSVHEKQFFIIIAFETKLMAIPVDKVLVIMMFKLNTNIPF